LKWDEFVGVSKYYRTLANRARQQYDQSYATGYRESDDLGINAPTHTDLGNLLTEVSMSFGRPITVIDLGCGTGRYFRCLRNVNSLIGVDVSPDMLRLARHPVGEDDILFPITLMCNSIADVNFADGSFDLVYAMGVFGHYLPLDAYILDNVSRMLKKGGKFVFTTVDVNSPTATSWKRRAAEAFLPTLPSQLRLVVRARLRNFRISVEDLESLMERTHFSVNSLKTRHFASLTEFVCVAGRD
jgi:SAM-dependent methyltransferase